MTINIKAKQLDADVWIERAQALALQLQQTAAQRDKTGGTPKAERDLIRDSGLLALSIPSAYGGAGADWSTIFATIGEIATADSSLAHVYGFHHLLIATVQLFAQPTQYAPWLKQTAEQQLFWGNALNPLDSRTKICQQGADTFIFDGEKSFSSGSIDSDFLLLSGHFAANDTEKLLIAVVPTRRQGIRFAHDWDNMGQRQTDSGTTHFEQLQVHRDELLLNPGPLSTPFTSLRPLIAQLIFVHLFWGQAQGLFNIARQQVPTQKAWFKSNLNSAADDPYIQKHIADFWVKLQGIRLLMQQAVQILAQAWAQGEQLDDAGRGEVAIAVATAKIAATEASLYITQNAFQVLGARATTAKLGLDRFWRNVRTQTLHDPIDYKYQELGQWLLTGQYPTPSFYS